MPGNIPKTKCAVATIRLAYERLELKENAREAAKRALEIDPNYKPAAELLKAIGP